MTSRAWCFTINSFSELDCGYVMSMADDAVYIICGAEKGSKKSRDHLQGYVYFRNAKSLMRMKKYLPRAHLEVSKGTPEQNKDYCSKDGDVWIHGCIPQQGAISRDKLEDIMSNPYDNFHLYNQYRRAYNELKAIEVKDHSRDLFILPVSDKYKVARTLVGPICMDIRSYNGENVVFVEYEHLMNSLVEDWINGFPQNIKRGYEFIRFDPSLVYIVCDGPLQFVSANKLYNDLITY